MEKEKNSVSLDQRIKNVREAFKIYSYPVNFWYEDCAPCKEEGALPLQLKESEVEAISPLLSNIFHREIAISKFFLVITNEKDCFKFGIDKGLASVGEDKCSFEYLVTQNCEFSNIQYSCKNTTGKGIDQEIYPIVSFSSMPEESQELISSILDIVESRMV